MKKEIQSTLEIPMTNERRAKAKVILREAGQRFDILCQGIARALGLSFSEVKKKLTKLLS